MIKFKSLVEEINWEELKKLTGSYALQGHVTHKEEVNLRNVEPEATIPEVGTGNYLPPHGFWTSTVYKDLKNFTTKWKKTPWINPKRRYIHVYTIQGDPRIIHIDTKKKAEKFLGEYIEDEDVKWDEVSREADAVHAWDGGLNSDILERWDVESTVWFKPKGHLKEQFAWKLNKRTITNIWQEI